MTTVERADLISTRLESLDRFFTQLDGAADLRFISRFGQVAADSLALQTVTLRLFRRAIASLPPGTLDEHFPLADLDALDAGLERIVGRFSEQVAAVERVVGEGMMPRGGVVH